MRRHALDQVEKAFRLIVEPIEHDVLYTQRHQSDYVPHRCWRHDRVDDHWKRGMTRDGLLDRFSELPVAHGRVDDQEIDCFASQQGVQLR